MAVTWQQVFPQRVTNSEGKNGGDYTQPEKMWRAQVPGGWLVYVAAKTSEIGNIFTSSQGAGLTFLPDPEHEWTP